MSWLTDRCHKERVINCQQAPRPEDDVTPLRPLYTFVGAGIYKYDFNDLFAEGVYMKMRLKTLTSLESLPKSEEPVVYLIAPEFPQIADRNWRGLLASPLKHRHRKLYLWRGEWQGRKNRFRRSGEEAGAYRP